jgi:hypothetical protein
MFDDPTVEGSMPVSHSDRVVKTLALLASMAYYVTWAGGVLVLLGLPAVKAVGGNAADFHYSLDLPVIAPTVESTVQTAWGPAPLEVDDVRGELKLPISAMPWSLLALLWSYAAVGFALMLVFSSTLRRLFQRVRDGAAFDVENAVRLRSLGRVLLAIAALNAIAELATSIAVRRGLAPGSSLAVPSGWHVDLSLVPVALVLMALAEIFRRGAALEHEQSLVV